MTASVNNGVLHVPAIADHATALMIASVDSGMPCTITGHPGMALMVGTVDFETVIMTKNVAAEIVRMNVIPKPKLALMSIMPERTSFVMNTMFPCKFVAMLTVAGSTF